MPLIEIIIMLSITGFIFIEESLNCQYMARQFDNRKISMRYIGLYEIKIASFILSMFILYKILNQPPWILGLSSWQLSLLCVFPVSFYFLVKGIVNKIFIARLNNTNFTYDVIFSFLKFVLINLALASLVFILSMCFCKGLLFFSVAVILLFLVLCGLSRLGEKACIIPGAHKDFLNLIMDGNLGEEIAKRNIPIFISVSKRYNWNAKVIGIIRPKIVVGKSFCGNVQNVNILKAILAHELGHIVLHHNKYLSIIRASIVVLIMFMFTLYAQSIGPECSFQILILDYVVLLSPLLLGLITAYNVISRKFEQQADSYSKILVGQEVFSSLSDDIHNNDSPKEHPLHFYLFSSHPYDFTR